MPAKPSTNKCDKHNSMVNRHIGTAYDTVKIVADNIEIIEEIGDNLPYLLKYLGAYSTPPTQRPDGTPLQDGDYYFDSVSEALVYYKLATDEWFEVDPQEILNARDEAIAARDAAQLAQANAETAEANAAASELAAAQSENNAATSASEAATSESNAATSESNAAGSAADALASENAALASELAAAQSEANASTSESNANMSAQAAAQSEANALASETNAAGSAVAAAQSAADAEQAFDNFTDLYLGAHTEDPTTDNDGNPLQVGATYWNIPNTTLLYWSGIIWDSPEETAIQAANTAIAARDDAQISETNAAASADDADLSATNAATSEGNAANSASTAQTAATTAGNHATTATNAASAASQSEINAAASEVNALASENKAELWAEEDEDVEVEPNRYSAKHWAAKAEQEAGVLTWQKHVRTDTDLNQVIEQNKDARAASGFDHYGQRVEDGSWDAINEGLWAPEEDNISAVYAENTLHMGVVSDNANGSSETVFAKTAIAGFISDLDFNQYNPSGGGSGDDWCLIKFPEAPDGTIIYDSTGDVRGTGSTNLDLTVDVDPKYGDVAVDLNEAVARAFEGELHNGDLRLGSTSWNFGTGWSIDNSTQEIVATSVGVNTITWNPVNVEVGQTYTYHISVTEITQGSFRMYVRGNSGTFHDFIDLKEGSNTLTRTATESIELIVIYATGGSGSSGRFTNGAVQVSTEEVVIDRHDMFGGEFFLEEVSGSNPYVYPKGMIQSQAGDMNGIVTVATNRPATYYAVYTGDTGSNGLGVDFWAATDAEKIAMVSDESNNLFLLGDGRLVQWRMRQVTVPSNKNGDWYRLGSNNPLGQVLSTFPTSHSYVSPQGMKDDALIWYDSGAGSTSVWYPATHVSGSNTEVGVYKAGIGGETNDETVGINGECYFHVWGVVRRLNQGAYHPSFNPLGANLVDNIADDNHGFWYEATANDLYSTVEAFTKKSKVPGTGAIGGVSGRDDDRFYDAIYAGGDGGVNDYRLSSWDMSSKEEAAKVFHKVVNGTYRGEEELVYTSTFASTTIAASSSSVIKIAQADLKGDVSWISSSSVTPAHGSAIVNGVVHKVVGVQFQSGDSNRYWLTLEIPASMTSGATVQTCFGYYIGSSVSGEFQMKDVVGDPAEILATPDLANGWQGGWVPQIYSGSGNFDIYATRKSVETLTNARLAWTDDSGSSWAEDRLGTITGSWDDTLNKFWGVTWLSARVAIFTYTAFAKQTVEANNVEVLNQQEGVGNVFQLARTDYSQLSESLMGKVCTSASTKDLGFLELESYTLDHVNRTGQNAQFKLSTATNYLPKHSPVDMVAPSNDSPACKALWYQTANSQQVSLNFAWNELIYKAPTFISRSGSDTALLSGYQNIKVTSGPHEGMVFKRHLSGNFGDAVNSFLLSDNALYYEAALQSGAGPSLIAWTPANGAWGDNGFISITDGTSTYINLNGDTCLRGTATLSKPIGYTKNQARVGTQTEGVDL